MTRFVGAVRGETILVGNVAVVVMRNGSALRNGGRVEEIVLEYPISRPGLIKLQASRSVKVVVGVVIDVIGFVIEQSGHPLKQAIRDRYLPGDVTAVVPLRSPA